MSQPPPDNRFLALRSAAQEATDFAMSDDTVRRFMQLRDAGEPLRDVALRHGVDAALYDETINLRVIAAGNQA